MRELPLWIDALAALLVVVGVVFALVGSLGLVKLSDFLKRLHGPTKASTLGVGCVLIASMLYFAGADRAEPHELLITLFVFLATPVSAHLLVSAGLRLDPRLAPPDLPDGTQITAGEPERDASR